MSDNSPKLPADYNILIFDHTTSTNDECKLLCRNADLPKEHVAGNFIWATTQTQGRGRSGKQWISPEGNLYVSLILSPEVPFAKLTELPFIAAVATGQAIIAAIDHCYSGDSHDEKKTIINYPKIEYKWPNDIIINNKKLGGILIETIAKNSEMADYAIIGMGVNIAHFPIDNVDFSATCLHTQGFTKITAEILLSKVMKILPETLTKWKNNGFAPILLQWQEHMFGVGQLAKIKLMKKEIEGVVIDVDNHGNIRLQQDTEIITIGSGELKFPNIVENNDEMILDFYEDILSKEAVKDKQEKKSKIHKEECNNIISINNFKKS